MSATPLFVPQRHLCDKGRCQLLKGITDACLFTQRLAISRTTFPSVSAFWRDAWERYVTHLKALYRYCSVAIFSSAAEVVA